MTQRHPRVTMSGHSRKKLNGPARPRRRRKNDPKIETSLPRWHDVRVVILAKETP
jgi:hypothetical protein